MKELIYHRLLLPAIEREPDKVTILDGEYRSTQAQHFDRTCRLAHALARQLGIARDDRFAVMALNSHHYLELYHAAYLGAGVISPLTRAPTSCSSTRGSPG
jgi:acyl-CoA synthetase (AMP-forming)/AMP-acid ligase II